MWNGWVTGETKMSFPGHDGGDAGDTDARVSHFIGNNVCLTFLKMYLSDKAFERAVGKYLIAFLINKSG